MRCGGTKVHVAVQGVLGEAHICVRAGAWVVMRLVGQGAVMCSFKPGPCNCICLVRCSWGLTMLRLEQHNDDGRYICRRSWRVMHPTCQPSAAARGGSSTQEPMSTRCVSWPRPIRTALCRDSRPRCRWDGVSLLAGMHDGLCCFCCCVAVEAVMRMLTLVVWCGQVK